MNKVIWVALREFASTALTKGFIVGVLMTPVMILIVAGAAIAMKGTTGPRLVGTVAVIDRTGVVGARIVERFAPEALEREAEETSQAIAEHIDRATEVLPLSEPQREMARRSVEAEAGRAKASARLRIDLLPADADPDAEKEAVRRAEIRTSDAADGQEQRLALVVVPAEVLRPPVPREPASRRAGFEAYFARRLDFEIQERITSRVRDAIVDARLEADPRLSAAGLTPEEVRALVAAPRSEARTLSRTGEKSALGELSTLVPVGFMMLMMIAVFTGGQYLLTTTVEEKSSRVMEILLSATSATQLMTGKILGQMLVGLLILVLYSATGIGMLVWLAREDLVEPLTFIYLFVFFLIAYFLIASMMAAIGAAVNDMREAQTLMAPVMIILMIPWLTWFFIQRAPNSLLATVLSFIPGLNPFVMMMRLGGSEPVPAWQVPVAIAIGVVSVVAAGWGAGKIFRIGALMHGRPPNFATLVRWVRMA
jgi:ABC-2 type transport system permease protein